MNLSLRRHLQTWEFEITRYERDNSAHPPRQHQDCSTSQRDSRSITTTTPTTHSIPRYRLSTNQNNHHQILQGSSIIQSNAIAQWTSEQHGKEKAKEKERRAITKEKESQHTKERDTTTPTTTTTKEKEKAMVPSVKEMLSKVHQKATPAKASHHLTKEKERTTPQHATNVANKVTLPGNVEFPSTTTTWENKATCQIQHTIGTTTHAQQYDPSWYNQDLTQQGFANTSQQPRLCQHITTCVATTTTGIIQFSTGHQLCRRGPHCWHRRSPRRLIVKDIIV